MSRKYYVLLLIALLYATWTYVFKPSPNLADMPQSTRISENVQKFGSYTITDLEQYAGEFRILRREEYRSGREAELSPVDFAVGWGKMADPAVYQKLDISQSGRWYFWRYANEPPIPRREIETHSANMHIIPANAYVADQLKKVKKDDLVYLKGALVEVQAEEGWHWRSSLSREDTGNGACELMRVDEVRFL
ncbi:MAG: hypothetical protein E6Q25_02125 [Acinetobacter sp.]|jgi:hypothetical protein|nr:MAG: hypothetical protein E6Q25_02125 [Acinetobacter sp.]